MVGQKREDTSPLWWRKSKNGEYYLITARESTKSEKVLYKKKAN